MARAFLFYGGDNNTAFLWHTRQLFANSQIVGGYKLIIITKIS